MSLFASVQSYLEEDREPQKKSILYENLRLKNRENYEVTLTQKADAMLKAPTEKDPERSKKQGEQLRLESCSRKYSNGGKNKEIDMHSLDGQD